MYLQVKPKKYRQWNPPERFTEIQILKHMYQYGDAAQTFPNQAAISATLLEQSN